MKPRDDPTIARIRETRHQISERFGHDPQKLIAYYVGLQKKYQIVLWARQQGRHRLQKAPSKSGRRVSCGKARQPIPPRAKVLMPQVTQRWICRQHWNS